MSSAPSVPLEDRGLSYGDGVFETFALCDGVLLGLERHLQRLRLGCSRLGFAAPSPQQIDAALAPACAPPGRAVVKLVVTRGRGGRGYRPPARPCPAVYVSRHAWPDGIDVLRTQGIAAVILAARVADNPALAGFKHLNRLEQVLASMELARTPAAHEGVVTAPDGRVVSGVMSNLFLLLDDELITPCLRRCGVDGIIRAAVLELAAGGRLPPVTVRDVTVRELEGAAEVFMTNSVRGLLPVRSMGARQLRVAGPVVRAVRAALDQSGLLA